MQRNAIVGSVLGLSLALAGLWPQPAGADGKASTRNIILGGAAASAVIINHNKKVHERYAEDSRRIAELDDARAWERSRYVAAHAAYEREVATNAQYRREMAFQHTEVVRLRHELALAGRSDRAYAAAPVHSAKRFARRANATPASRPTVVSYGWGTL